MYLEYFKVKLNWQLPVIVLLLLVPLSIVTPLLFHTLVESFAIVVAILTFVVAFNTYPFSNSHFLMYIGCGYFWVGMLDFAHMITFSSFNMFPSVDEEVTIHFWILARIIEIFVLVSFTSFVSKPVHPKRVFWLFGLASIIGLILVAFGLLPRLYSEGTGLTTTKIVGEYILITACLIAAYRLYKIRQTLNQSVYKLLLISIALTIFAEICLTLYEHLNDVPLIIGHFFKLLSFWLVYVALVESTLTQPFKSLLLSTDTFNGLPDAIALLSSNGIVLNANNCAHSFSGATEITQRESIVGQSAHNVFHNPKQSIEECSICSSFKTLSTPTTHEVELEQGWFELTLIPTRKVSDETLILHVCRNIKRRVEAQSKYTKSNQLYTVLRLTNKATIISQTRQQLCDSVCRISVENGGFLMADIGFIKDQEIVPVSSYGDTSKHFSLMDICLDDLESSEGPIGVAIKTQKVSCINDIENDLSFASKKEEALACGFRSQATIPIVQNQQCIGVFVLYADEVGAFDEETLDLLTVLSDDISSIIGYIQVEEKRRLAEAKLKQLSLAIEQSKSAIFITDLSGKIEYINPYFTVLMGYTETEVIDQNIEILFDPQSDSVLEAYWDAVKRGGDWQNEILTKTQDNASFWAYLSVSPIFNSEGNVDQIVWSSKDNTELHRAQETINHLAYYDALTNLPNRRLFHDRFQQAIVAAKRHKMKLALMYFDLDNFKAVNDRRGHDFGDLLLKDVAATLGKNIRETDTVARLGGDEFAIIINDLSDNKYLMHIASNVLQQLNSKRMLINREVSITTSIGISLFPDDGETCEQLLKCADMAMYHAKDKGRNNFQFFEEFLNINAQYHMKLERKIIGALEKQHFILHYQPQFNIDTGNLSGVEVLIRWPDPEQGMVSPGEFIPIAEESSLIVRIGEWVMEHACREFKSMIDQGLPPVKMAVNISAVQFQDTKSLLKTIEGAIDNSGLPSHLLQLELTESVLIKNVSETLAVIDELRLKNITFAIDDFGTGYSSLSYLKNFPVDIVKIDQSFIRDIENDSNGRAIIRAISLMAHELDLKVLAEGIENHEQLTFLKSNNCDFAQGFFLAKPISADDLLNTFGKK